MEHNDTFNTLKDSPIYAMSLGSHELFHSNIWAWLMKKYPQSINDIFEIDVEKDSVTIDREARNKDITITNKDTQEIWIIENKFKSLPYVEQLIKYEEDLKNKGFKKGLLICLVDPEFQLNSWKCITYDTLLQKMKKFLGNITDEFDKSVLENYIETTHITVDIITKNFKNDMQLSISNKDFEEEFERYRIGDILRKLNASYFLKEKKNEILQELNISAESIRIDTDYSKKDATINAFISLDDTVQPNDKLEHFIGVQIQGNRFCLCVSLPKSKKADKVFEYYVNKNWFDPNFQKNGTIFDFNTSMRPKNKKYNKYDSLNNVFIYQYFNLNSKSFNDISKMLIKFLNKASDIKNAR